MEKKLNIYIKYNKIKVRKIDIILYSLISIVVIIYNSNYLFYNNKNESLETLGFLSILITFPYFIFFLIYNSFRYEKINGDLSKELVFENEKIIVGDEIYYLNEIEKIQIYNSDIKGQLVNATLPLFPHLSNGLKNYVELHFIDGKQMKIYFLQTENEKIEIFENEFNSYYKNNKMSSQNLSNLIDIKSQNNMTKKKRLILYLLFTVIFIGLVYYNYNK